MGPRFLKTKAESGCSRPQLAIHLLTSLGEGGPGTSNRNGFEHRGDRELHASSLRYLRVQCLQGCTLLGDWSRHRSAPNIVRCYHESTLQVNETFHFGTYPQRPRDPPHSLAFPANNACEI